VRNRVLLSQTSSTSVYPSLHALINFHDPAVMAKNFLALKSLYLVTDGIFLWEFITTLDYEVQYHKTETPLPVDDMDVLTHSHDYASCRNS